MTLARIGRFAVERPLGTGSFATVWLARDDDLDAAVAIKLLADNWSLDVDARRRFLDEARALRRLDSDRIVRVYELGWLPDGRPYMVMEYADRGTLEDRMRLRAQLDQPFSVREAVGIGMEVAECLTAAHDLHIVHRDVKPSNVLFRSIPRERREALRREGGPAPAERTLLGDFGIARRLEGIPGRTRVVGSPEYMAPEQADPSRASSVDGRADVYAAAVILHELLTGTVPSQAGPDALERHRDVPVTLAEAIRRALEPNPGDRFRSAWEWREALRASLAETEGARGGRGFAPGRDAPPPSARPEVDTVPLGASARAPSGRPLGGPGSTAVAATRRSTSVPWPDEGGGIDEQPVEPSPDGIGGATGVGRHTARPHFRARGTGAAFLSAAAAAGAALFFPLTAGRSFLATTADLAGVTVPVGAVVAAAAVFLAGAGAMLWRTRRRWVARSLALVAFPVGGGLALLGLFALLLTLLGGEPLQPAGLLLTTGAGIVAAPAALRLLRRRTPATDHPT